MQPLFHETPVHHAMTAPTGTASSVEEHGGADMQTRVSSQLIPPASAVLLTQASSAECRPGDQCLFAGDFG
jgi:hypothetical protein